MSDEPEHGWSARAFGRMEGKLDLILNMQAAQKETTDGLSAKLDKHDARLTVVESRITKWGGALAILLGLFALYGKPVLIKLGLMP